MSNATLYHNPRCSKSRQALQFLQDNTVDVEIIEYLKNPPTYSELESIFNALPITSALDMVRNKEAEFKEADLNKDSTNEEVLHAVFQYPKLLERPILLMGNVAAIGRPLENIKALVDD